MNNNTTKNINNITLLGGSFNPIHLGHIAMAVCAHEEFGLDNIVFMPNKTTYYKENTVFAPDEDRLAMIKLAIKDYPYMSVSDMEISRGGVTRTIDTVRELKAEDSERDIYFILGGDSLEWVDKWVDADELLVSVTFLAAVRGETDRERSLEIIERIMDEHPGADIRLLDMEEMPISSSEIRRRVVAGEDISNLVPAAVEEYINRKNLYIM
ncbi:MAG: nicotinate-nucleotide adenylyltransferase [Eubacterium sp.]|nr:nicotinate-nucleotide adenylyltransferase [Eubacterium sp.]